MTAGARVAVALLALVYAAALAAPLLAPHGPDDQFRDAAWTAPGPRFPMGSDGLGRDQLSRLLYGARVSLLAGTAAALLAVALGGLLGALAGAGGPAVDAVLMRAADLSLALPWTYALLALRAALPLELSPGATFAALMLVLGVVGWARPARLARGIVLASKDADYVRAARSFGASNIYVLWNHLLPEARSALAVHFVLAVPQYLMAEATLSFLGLGFSDGHPSWGNLLSALLRLNVLAEYWWMALPALVFGAVLACCHAAGRGWEAQAGADQR
jgi:peptide/nickel transport system permease protein